MTPSLPRSGNMQIAPQRINPAEGDTLYRIGRLQRVPEQIS